MIYSIVDIETTGGSNGNRITEIAVCKTDGQKVLDTYETLINPGTYISHSISLLTGITNSMVEHAPRFEDQAETLLEFLEGTVFVAHNVSFDYSIIKNHYYDIERTFNMKKLCTVRLARGILKNQASYSLGKLCHALNIHNENRHRAMGDAAATAELFLLLLERDEEDFLTHSLNQLNREAVLPPNLPKEEYDELPETPGVYYFFGSKMEVLYIGKAKNIKKRVGSHFLEKSRKKSELLRRIHHVTFESTGNELIALLLESAEIKSHYPPYNKAQKSKAAAYHVSYYAGQDGILRFDIFKKRSAGVSVANFTSVVMARDFLFQLVDQHGLCPKYCGLERTKNKCSKGPLCEICNELMDVESYNEKVRGLKIEKENSNVLIIGKGRSPEEKSAVYVQDGNYIGYGFFETQQIRNETEVLDSIKRQTANADTARILKQFLKGPGLNSYDLIDLDQQVTQN
ncbi:GIY-YIG nuclease family protein [bacterium]|nr:GIY-YIG nuclease family protein [bacterium]